MTRWRPEKMSSGLWQRKRFRNFCRQILMVFCLLLLLAGCGVQSLEPVKTLNYGLPLIRSRIVDDRYLVGYQSNDAASALVTYDLRDPFRPIEVNRWVWEEESNVFCPVHFEDDYAYRQCREPNQEFSVVNIEDILNPKLLLREEGEYDFDEFTVRDGYMYTLKNDLVQLSSTFAIWTVSDLNQIRQIASLPLPGLSYVIESGEHIFLFGNHVVFVGYGSSGRTRGVIYSVDISDPRSPHIVSEFDGGNRQNGGSYASLAAASNYLYAGQYGVGLRIVDMSNPVNPQTVGVLRDTSPIRALVIHKDRIHMLGDFRFRVVDISNPRRPKLLARTDLRSYAGAVIGDYVYVLDHLYAETYIYEAP